LPIVRHFTAFASMSDVTRILSQIEQGDPQAAEQLLPLVYGELRKLAASKLTQEKTDQTLQATALVHEAYLRLVGPVGSERTTADNRTQSESRSAARWHSRGHFFASAAEAMRRILVEQARRKSAEKRGGKRERVPLDEEAAIQLADDSLVLELVALDDALTQFESLEPLKARLVKLRYFAGVPLEEAAALLDISPATAKRYWIYARSWLFGKLQGE
jgi:RNA polymerase sigma factor (TIGR02999 family)